MLISPILSWGNNEDDEVGSIFDLYPVDYLKELLIPEINKLLKHTMYLG